MCNAARGMLFSLGCIQSRNCNNNRCPTGITTQDPKRTFALNVDDKAPNVASFHATTIRNFLDVLGAAGIDKVSSMSAAHVCRRTDISNFHTYANIFPYCRVGDLLNGKATSTFNKLWADASADRYVSAKDVIL